MEPQNLAERILTTAGLDPQRSYELAQLDKILTAGLDPQRSYELAQLDKILTRVEARTPMDDNDT